MLAATALFVSWLLPGTKSDKPVKSQKTLKILVPSLCGGM